MLGQTDNVMLGAIQSEQEVGFYAAATRLAYLLMYCTVAAEFVVSPNISRYYVKGEIVRIHHTYKKAVRMYFGMALLLGVTFIVAGKDLFAFFSDDFIFATSTLLILVAGRLISVALESGSLLLGMIGNERIAASVIFGVSIASILLNSFLIPARGIEGAALATSISLIFMQILLCAYSLKKVRVDVAVFDFCYLGENRSP